MTETCFELCTKIILYCLAFDLLKVQCNPIRAILVTVLNILALIINSGASQHRKHGARSEETK